MPELPEVQTVVDSIRPRLEGKPIRQIELLRADIVAPPSVDLPALLRGRAIRSVTRRGKRIMFGLDNGQSFYIHLGMTGRLSLARRADPVLKHTHLHLRFDDDLELRFRDPRRFGGVWWLGDLVATNTVMGPEPLSVRASALAKRLRRTRRAIKTALLDQQLIAGLGNIYVDESLFEAKIHPRTPANQLTAAQAKSLSKAIKLTLRRALRHRGSTLRDYVDANGAAGAFQKLHRVYARKGAPCPRCATPIQKIVQGGRSTHFCPKCQRADVTEVA